jgi:hypothetical protein
MVDTAEIPDRFMDAITAALASRLSIKEKRFDIYQTMKAEEMEAFNLAAYEDEENVPVKIKIKPSKSWSAV